MKEGRLKQWRVINEDGEDVGRWSKSKGKIIFNAIALNSEFEDTDSEPEWWLEVVRDHPELRSEM